MSLCVATLAVLLEIAMPWALQTDGAVGKAQSEAGQNRRADGAGAHSAYS
jgi:hypothetical protein